ncbi:hypothetical protein SAMN02990966_07459 [Rhodospirillales bacterium URHD0017]|nr:hypothetical protein SAMN02990966_07459 [Rhodospirillales bacterium URHD0017]
MTDTNEDRYSDGDLGRALAASPMWNFYKTPQFSPNHVWSSGDRSGATKDILWGHCLNVLDEEGNIRVSFDTLRRLGESWIEQVLQPARERWDTWGRVAPRVRLNYGEPATIGWQKAFKALAHPAVGLGALMVAHRSPRGDHAPNWHWPIRIAVQAPQTELTAILRSWHDETHAHPWLANLALLSPVSIRTERVDVLFLDGATAEEALYSSIRLRPEFVLQRVQTDMDLRATVAQAEEVITSFYAHGAALLAPSIEPAQFLSEFVRNLSHDHTVHAAVWNVDRGGIPPIIVGDARALDRMCIAGVADSYSVAGRESPRRFWQRYNSLDGSSGLIKDLRGDIGFESTGLGEAIRQRPFNSETGSGVPAANELAAADRDCLEETARASRRVQMAILDAFDEESVRESFYSPEMMTETDGRFVANAVNLARVRISTEKLQASSDVEFPTNALDANGEALIEVRFEVSNSKIVVVEPDMGIDLIRVRRLLRAKADADAAGEAATGSLHLPRTGPSTDAFFLIRAFARSGETVKGTMLLSVNRRLQQAIDVSIAVSDRRSALEELEPGPALRLQVRALPFPEFIGAVDRREFDLGLFVNDGSDGMTPRIVAINEAQSGLPLAKLENTTSTISKEIAKIAYRDKVEVAWTDDEIVTALRALAHPGSLMRTAMERFWPTDREPPQRIAIAGPWESYVPIEYVYEGPAPDFGARHCLEALDKWKKGQCGDCIHRRAQTVVCPLRFWGLSSEIERRYADTLEQAHPGQGPGRRQLKRMTSSLLGYSDRATNFPGGSTQVADLARRLSKVAGSAVRAEDWTKWCEGVSTHSPNLLVLLPHTGVYENIEALELGTGTAREHWRAKASISKADVGLSDEVELVALLGCNTAESGANFATYPERFRRYGADLLLTTIATVRGADAVPIAREVVDMLEEANMSLTDLKTFGAFATELRRRALLKGAPGVLGVVAYGDADWIVGNAGV